MYEQFGIEGLKAYDRTVKYCQQKGLIVIGDIKRGDIGSTSAAYATGHLGSVKVGNNDLFRGFNTEYVTVNPYLGTDGVKPFVDVCNACRPWYLCTGKDIPTRPAASSRIVWWTVARFMSW